MPIPWSRPGTWKPSTVHSDFALLASVGRQEELDRIAEQLKPRLDAIKELEGNKLTMRIQIAAVLRSSEGITDESMYQKALEAMVDPDKK